MKRGWVETWCDFLHDFLLWMTLGSCQPKECHDRGVCACKCLDWWLQPGQAKVSSPFLHEFQGWQKAGIM